MSQVDTIKEFEEFCTGDSQIITMEDFFRYFSKYYSNLAPYSSMFYKLFSSSNKMTLAQFQQFKESILLIETDELNEDSPQNYVFNYICSKNSNFIGVEEMIKFGCLLSGSKNSMFTREAAFEIMKDYASNLNNGMSKFEFFKLFDNYICNHQLESENKPNDDDTENEQLDSIIIRGENPKDNKKIVINYLFPKHNYYTDSEIFRLQYEYDNDEINSAIPLSLFQEKIRNNCLIPVKFAKLALKIYGKKSYINFDGYCALNYAVSVEPHNPMSFCSAVFNYINKSKTGVLDFHEFLNFCRLVSIDVSSPGFRTKWLNIIRECKLLYHTDVLLITFI